MKIREIKFRAWDKKNKEMKDYYDFPFWTTLRNDSYMVMQYTGLKDKNGKDCYEGDILLHKGKIYWVEWQDYRFRLIRNTALGEQQGGHPFKQMFSHPENFEIVGNIHENNLSEWKHLTLRSKTRVL